MKKKKGFFRSHSKSSAALVSLAIHAILILAAFFFVAVSVVKKDDVDFAAKPVSRPKMNLRRLQVPVNTKTPPKQPRLRKQIMVKPINKVAPDIKMPEIVGVIGGLGSAGSSLGGGPSLGFSLPEINFFGVKGTSEKILLILNGDEEMSSDNLGGAYGFEVIKKECLNLIDGLPFSAVFNIVVYDGRTAIQLFESMAPASDGNVQKAKDWLMPLNQVIGAKTKYGLGTLGSGGTKVDRDFPFGKFKEDVFEPRSWNVPVLQAMKQQADTVFLLTNSWGSWMYIDPEEQKALHEKWFQTAEGQLFKKKAAEGRKLLDEDNKKRKAAGEPPNALNRNSDRAIVRYFFDGVVEPPNAPHQDLGVKDFIKAFKAAYKAYSKDAPKLGIKKKKSKFALNVIYFKQEEFKDEKSQRYSDLHEGQFSALAKALDGECRSIAGLSAIKSYVDASSLEN